MYSQLFSGAAGLGVALLMLAGVTQQSDQPSSSSTQPAPPSSLAAPPADDHETLRGYYLTHYVAMCVVCHSPKDETGMVVEGQEFEGAVIPVANPFPNGKPWAVRAPALRPLVEGAEEDVFHLLTTGIWKRTGEAPQGPMPPFRMNEEDARAVIAYLKATEQKRQ